MGGFVAGQGVDDTNNDVYVRRISNSNVPLLRTGVDGFLGPGLGADVVFKFVGGPELSATGDVSMMATIAGSGITPANNQGIWRNTTAGNLPFARTGDDVLFGPALGAGISFDNDGGIRSAFGFFEFAEGTDDVFFNGTTLDSASGTKGVGFWRNSGIGNIPLAVTGATGNLGPGLGAGLMFGDLNQVGPATEWDSNSNGNLAFFLKLADRRGGLWRNDGQKNVPLMLAGESGDLGPGVGIDDVFENFFPAEFLAKPAINDENKVLFPARLIKTKQEGLWLNSGGTNHVIALTGSDGEFGPGLGPDVAFSGFNRAYFGDDDTIYFTANLSPGVPSNRLLGLWAYRHGEIHPIVIYNELLDVNPSAISDERRVGWVQIPSDFNSNNDFVQTTAISLLLGSDSKMAA